ncbi:hypothetical protein D0Y50_09280 [Salinimonas sediminis]|uniref:Uncharacterized protein n=1 Tax=Salinimonas sediminis TaxID=2303538 RepID=A0A346NLY3_9ALTE|nr:hypothetical protein D0Y50_09280 [Salinimonas sediminis]
MQWIAPQFALRALSTNGPVIESQQRVLSWVAARICGLSTVNHSLLSALSLANHKNLNITAPYLYSETKP